MSQILITRRHPIALAVLSGTAGMATAVMLRVMDQWPAQRQALEAAVQAQAVWVKALDGVQDKLREADVLVSKAQWASSHEVLEHVREHHVGCSSLAWPELRT